MRGPDVIGDYTPDAISGRLPKLRQFNKRRADVSGSGASGSQGRQAASELQASLENVELEPADELDEQLAEQETGGDVIETMKELFEVAKSMAEQAAKDLAKANQVKREIGEQLAKILKKQRRS